ncbi:MAG: hypothetical protein GY821_12835 [Gammaproteobacteria bacterium]|nr:hypothetical protein [Gammaproteobacteria bacterium]
MNEKRKVVVYKWEKVKTQNAALKNGTLTYDAWKKIDDKVLYEKVVVGEGIFHQFGVDYEEFECSTCYRCGPGNYSTAIIEMPDGTIKNVEVELIVFIN